MVHVVTGAAGFIGSTLVDALLADGHDVVGIDCFTDYYDVASKRANLTAALTNDRFRLAEADLRDADLDALLADAGPVEVLYHQAGQPGVRLSWDTGFATYSSCNIDATQRLLEASRRAEVPRIVYASSSSIYGDADRYPVTEQDLPQPFSPYGVTKLAGEHLCSAYADNHGMSIMSLRYFTVYGPRQRPDMAFHRMILAALDQTPFPLFGDGTQIRDFTFVGDAVRANVAAGQSDAVGYVNVCGGGSTVLNDVFDTVAQAVGQPVPIDRQPPAKGDMHQTGGSFALASELLGWKPETSLADGIAAEVDWFRSRR